MIEHLRGRDRKLERSDGPASTRNGSPLCASTAACSHEDSSVIISVRVAHRHFDSSGH